MTKFVVTCLCLCGATAFATVLPVEVGTTRGPDGMRAQLDSAVRQFAKNAAQLTRQERLNQMVSSSRNRVFSLPTNVLVTRNGISVPPPPASRGYGDPIVLNFAAGANAFPDDYKALLQSIATKVQPTIDSLFGLPSTGGNVTVSNYDADIGDRDALAGGYYFFDGGTNTQEIRFPIYSDLIGYKAEVAAVNFVHCLLLATIGPKMLPADGWQEGIVRAATMQICRTPGALPATLDSVAIEQVLESSYDIGSTYDWNNQRALSGPTFIAPNLRSQPLPAGGSTGGLYLLRYQMAGSAFQKVLVEYPGFAPEFLKRYYQNSAGTQTFGALAALGRDTIRFLLGPSATIEGQDFVAWSRRQRILDFNLTPGQKLQVQAFPITSGLSGADFGVFGIQVHWFRTNLDGSETLLRDTSYPIYWSPDFTRFFTAVQDDKMSIFNGYGSVVPNFPGSAFGGEPYRIALDLAVQDRVERLYLPAGAVATVAKPTPNNFYGCVTGLEPGQTYSVEIRWNGGAVAIPVQNGAFGDSLPNNFEQSRRNIELEVRKNGVPVLNQMVNKGPGPLAINLHVNGQGLLTPGTIPAGISLAGFVGEAYQGSLGDLIGSDPLAARWDATKSIYTRRPEFSTANVGQGFYVRAAAPIPLQYDALAPDRTPIAVATKTGWNIICNPLKEAVDVKDLVVVTGSDFPRSWDDATAAGLIAPDLFSLVQNPPDPASGVPEGGIMTSEATIQPGQAVYVKVFSTAGATLLFPTSDFQSRGRAGGPPSWKLQVSCQTTSGTVSAIIGASVGATRSFNGGLDSQLPPSHQGVQVSAMGAQRLYRDMRAFGRSETFNLQFERLPIGKPVTINFTKLAGKINKFVVSGLTTRRQLSVGSSFTFTPKSASPLLRIVVPVVSK